MVVENEKILLINIFLLIEAIVTFFGTQHVYMTELILTFRNRGKRVSDSSIYMFVVVFVSQGYERPMKNKFRRAAVVVSASSARIGILGLVRRVQNELKLMFYIFQTNATVGEAGKRTSTSVIFVSCAVRSFTEVM